MSSVGFEGLDGVWVVEYRSHVLSNLRFLQLVVEGLLSTPGVGVAFWRLSLLLFQASSMPEDWCGSAWLKRNGMPGPSCLVSLEVFQLLPREVMVHLPCWDETFVFKMVNQFSFSSPCPSRGSLRLWIYSLFKIEERFCNWLGVTLEIVRNFPGVCGFVFFF